jgi:hypothetical protein
MHIDKPWQHTQVAPKGKENMLKSAYIKHSTRHEKSREEQDLMPAHKRKG